MPRSVAQPEFPDSPGSWLACYRFRQHSESGSLSPELFGERIGVSGATVRRWETDRSRPHEGDIRLIAEACELSSIETEFLSIAFKAVPSEVPPSPALFKEYACEVLDSPHPAFLMDSFFFVRAYNSYNAVLAEPPTLAPGPMHILKRLGQLAEPGDVDRIRHLVRAFWFNTAGLCGSASYKSVLQHLREANGFEEAWRDLALDRGQAPRHPLNGPNLLTPVDAGNFRVFTSRITLPPIYYLLEHVPVDELAQRRLQEMRRAHPKPEIFLDNKIHWSQEEWAL